MTAIEYQQSVELQAINVVLKEQLAALTSICNLQKEALQSKDELIAMYRKVTEADEKLLAAKIKAAMTPSLN